MTPNSENAFETLLDSDAAAQLLHVHPKTLIRLARHGDVPAMRIGKLWRFRVSQLDAWLRAQVDSTVPAQ